MAHGMIGMHGRATAGKPDGEHIPVTLGNFADMAVEGRFTLIFVVFNTLFGLLSQDDQVGFETSVHDPLQQRVMTQQVVLTEQRIRFYPVQTRYAWPSELGLMARLAGLQLRRRWAGWAEEPFTASNTSHVSVDARVIEAPSRRSRHRRRG